MLLLHMAAQYICKVMHNEGRESLIRAFEVQSQVSEYSTEVLLGLQSQILLLHQKPRLKSRLWSGVQSFVFFSQKCQTLAATSFGFAPFLSFMCVGLLVGQKKQFEMSLKALGNWNENYVCYFLIFYRQMSYLINPQNAWQINQQWKIHVFLQPECWPFQKHPPLFASCKSDIQTPE